MYEWSKRQHGFGRSPKPEATVSPGAAVLLKVNRRFVSRCWLLRRSPTPTPPGPSMTQRDSSPAGNAPSTAAPSNKTLDRDASVGGNGEAMGTEPAQDGRSPMSAQAASQASDSRDGFAAGGDLRPVSGGRRSPGCQEAEEGRGSEEEDEEEEEEEERRLALVPMRRSSRLRASIRSRSPFRRHSWEPGKKVCHELDNDHERSFSLEDLDDDEIEAMQTMGVTARQGRDSRRTPIIHCSGEVESMLALAEEETEQDVGGAMRSDRQELFGALTPGAGVSLNKAGSITRIDETLAEGAQSKLQLKEGSTTLSDPTGCSTQESKQGSDLEPRGSTKVHRTVSFFKKMAGITKNKEKDKMKEREKEAKERETRITNGHLFNSITVSGNTLCYACNKSIIAKEAFICPNCSVTIHKSCKDTLPSCTKVKQKQLKAAQAKNNSALHNVSMRHKVPMGRERPNSAIYPSDSFRPSPLFSQLGSRRGRTPFQSLSKSVSTNNIGNLNDDTPLGIRRILSQSTDSLNMRNRTLSVESLIDEGAEVIYNQLMGDLETDEKDFEADSWSLAVDSSFLQQHKKDVMKRQDVIYELIQTEVHHMRTLKIMSDIFRKGMLEDLLMDRSAADTMFPALDDLIDIHVQFLSRLLERRKESLLMGSDKNFVINRLGDIMVSQFSGQSAESMQRAYAEFCSRHTKAVKLYKELFTRDKRFQQFVRRMTRSSVLRRHGIQECILLVTQRITKYPVLLDRIVQNTKGNEEDQRDLGHSLVLVKELITAVDQEVHECEKRFRLQDIYNRMDIKAVATMHSGRQFRREDLIRRKLVHDGFVLWKTATGRFKDIQVLLLTDVLLFLQEKDQRYSFPALDNKPAVISLQKLIVRDIANQEKGMFLISAAAQIPEMYEIHTASKEERSTWMKVIQQTVNVCPEMDDFSMEMETKEILKELADEIQQKDRGITDLLVEKANLFLQILQLKACEDLTLDLTTRKLFRSESSEIPKGEKLINDAVKEVQSLSELMINVCGASGQPVSSSSVDQSPGNVDPGGTESSTSTNGEQPNVNGTTELCRTDSLNSLGRDRNGNQLQVKSHNEEAMLRLSRLSVLLHGLQAIVVRQDSLIEAQRQQLGEQKGKLAHQAPKESPLVEQERLRSMEKQREELMGLGRQHSLLQEEFQRCRKSCDEKGQEVRALEARLQDSERNKAELEREREEWRRRSGGLGPETPVMVEQQRRKQRSHARQFSLPSAQFTCLGMTARQSPLQRRRSADESYLRRALTPEGPFNPPSASTDRSEGSSLPWLTGREAPLRTDCEAGAGRSGEGAELGPAQDGGLCLREEESGEESRSPSPSSSESSEEVTDVEQTQNVPEGSGSGQPAPGGGDSAPQPPATPQPEDDEDDLYY